ncbi:MAG TPA: carboxypeptidase regulatory-like domain-containing protein [bacterium]|nr:carboxypeptidase regulatory-like domain-containing protein [bacterium]
MKHKYIYFILIFNLFALPSCGGGGGGGTTAYVPAYGSIDGYVYVPIGSTPASRIVLDAQPGYEPLEGARVTASVGTSSKSTSTNSGGYFKLSSLYVGSWTVLVSKSGYSSIQNIANVSADTTTRIGGSNGVKVSPVSSGSIMVTANISGVGIIIDGKSTNISIPASLSYTFANISVGSHDVGVDSTGYTPVNNQTVNITEGSTAHVYFELIEPGTDPPVADAGEDGKTFVATYYTENGSVQDYTPHDNIYTLDGTGSFDPDGDTVTYSWLQTEGPSVALSSSSDEKPTFKPVADGTYTFQLIVNDGLNNSLPDYVSVYAKRPAGKLVFWVIDGNDAEIQTMNADGSDFKQITSDTADDQNPKWSNTGTRIVFQSAATGATMQIKIMNADGTGAFSVTNNSVSNITPSWSCDDVKILFSQAEDGRSNDDIYQIGIFGTGLTQLTNDNRGDLRPVYSDNCDKILFVSGLGDDYDVKIMDADGSNQTDLSNNSITHFYASWASDGRILYSESQYLGATEYLYVMNTDGSGKQAWPVPDSVHGVSAPTMSYDGEFIIYTDVNRILHIMYSDGSADMSYGVYGHRPDYHPGP